MKFILLITFCALLYNCEGYRNLEAGIGEYSKDDDVTINTYMLYETHNEVDDIKDVQIEITGSGEVVDVNEAYMESMSVDYIPVIFQKFPKLNVFTIRNSSDIELSEKFLENAGDLTELHIGFNIYSVIIDNTFKGCKNLKKIDLQNNEIEQISNNAFATLDHLKELDLSNNKLTALETGTFNLPALEILYISNNKLTQLEDNLFEGATKLKELSLYDNVIEDVSRTAFHGLKSLKELYLYNNEIKYFKRGTFDHLHNLQILSAYNNSLTIIIDHTFARCKNLKELQLSDNKIVATSPNVFLPMKKLETFRMDENLCYKGADEDMDISTITTEIEECTKNYDVIKRVFNYEMELEKDNKIADKEDLAE